MVVSLFETGYLVEGAGLFGLPPKSEPVIAAGSVTPWEPGGISETQLAAGQEAARRRGVPYDSHGASV